MTSLIRLPAWSLSRLCVAGAAGVALAGVGGALALTALDTGSNRPAPLASVAPTPALRTEPPRATVLVQPPAQTTAAPASAPAQGVAEPAPSRLIRPARVARASPPPHPAAHHAAPPVRSVVFEKVRPPARPTTHHLAYAEYPPPSPFPSGPGPGWGPSGDPGYYAFGPGRFVGRPMPYAAY